MTQRYVIILSEDPLELTATARVTDLALQLKKRGHAVTLFMVQNGVFASRSRSPRDPLGPLLAASIDVLADDFSLHERGIDPEELRPGVTAAPIGAVVTRLAAGWNALWS
jgi:hypothetical protein